MDDRELARVMQEIAFLWERGKDGHWVILDHNEIYNELVGATLNIEDTRLDVMVLERMQQSGVRSVKTPSMHDLPAYERWAVNILNWLPYWIGMERRERGVFPSAEELEACIRTLPETEELDRIWPRSRFSLHVRGDSYLISWQPADAGRVFVHAPRVDETLFWEVQPAPSDLDYDSLLATRERGRVLFTKSTRPVKIILGHKSS